MAQLKLRIEELAVDESVLNTTEYLCKDETHLRELISEMLIVAGLPPEAFIHLLLHLGRLSFSTNSNAFRLLINPKSVQLN